MSLILVLFVCGALLLAVEVVVPGAVSGIAGGIFLLLGVVVSASRFGFSGATVAAATAMVLVGVTLYLEFVLLPRSRLARALSMTETVAGQSQPPIAEKSLVVGKRAVALTTLAPSGYVELEGRRYEAFARSGLARPGDPLEIVDVDNFRLIVSKASTNHSI